MGIPWNRAAPTYLETFLPRFLPYHHDFVEELGAKEGEHVLAPTCGPGTDALAFARTIGERGRLRATDPDRHWSPFVAKRFQDAGVASRATFAVASADDASGGPFSIVASAFAERDQAAELRAFEAWRDALSPHGKIGRLEWGPGSDDDPYERWVDAVAAIAPELPIDLQIDVVVERAALAKLFESAGLVMVRHTVIRHTQVFTTAEQYVDALVPSLQPHIGEAIGALGEIKVQKIRARFLELVGGPTAPLSFQPAATIAIAALPGEEIELPHRPSVRVARSSPPEGTGSPS